MAKDDGQIGILFRVKDPFNFYVLEFVRTSGGFFGLQEPGGFKRIRKFINGKPTILQTLNDGGFLQDKWYKIIIKYRAGNI